MVCFFITFNKKLRSKQNLKSYTEAQINLSKRNINYAVAALSKNLYFEL